MQNYIYMDLNFLLLMSILSWLTPWTWGYDVGYCLALIVVAHIPHAGGGDGWR
jgi:hypothetical protein